MVNGSVNALMKQKFTEWYSKQFAQTLDGVPLDDIDIKLRLSVVKPFHARWLLDETGWKANIIIENGWK